MSHAHAHAWTSMWGSKIVTDDAGETLLFLISSLLLESRLILRLQAYAWFTPGSESFLGGIVYFFVCGIVVKWCK